MLFSLNRSTKIRVIVNEKETKIEAFQLIFLSKDIKFDDFYFKYKHLQYK